MSEAPASPHRRVGRAARTLAPAIRTSTTDLWKAAALLLILVDHYGHFIAPEADWLRVIGRASLPIWFFFIGFAATRTVPWTWPALGLALTAFDIWYKGGVADIYLNILINFALIRLALPWIDRHVWPSTWKLAGFVVVLALLAPWANALLEYGTEGWLLALVGFAHRKLVEPDGKVPAEAVFWRRVALAAAAGGVFVVLEAGDYAFSVNQTAVLVLLVALVSAALGQFRRAPLPSEPPVPFGAVLRFCGRQSLWLYAGQIVVLALVARLLDT